MIRIKLIVSQDADTSGFCEHSRHYTSEVSVVDRNVNNVKYRKFSGTKKEEKIKKLIGGKQCHMDQHLSISQHDVVLLNESREGNNLKETLQNLLGN